jgi:hypothetical protein
LPRTVLQVLLAGREIDLIQAAIRQTGERLQRESKHLTKLQVAKDLPAELKNLWHRCHEITATRQKLESKLSVLRDELEKQQAAARDKRNELRHQLQVRRGELRALPSDADPSRRDLAQLVAQLELAYAALEPARNIVAQVRQEEVTNQKLQGELLDTQKALAEKLLSATQPTADRPDSESAAGVYVATAMARQQMTSLLSQLDMLSKSLRRLISMSPR